MLHTSHFTRYSIYTCWFQKNSSYMFSFSPVLFGRWNFLLMSSYIPFNYVFIPEVEVGLFYSLIITDGYLPLRMYYSSRGIGAVSPMQLVIPMPSLDIVRLQHQSTPATYANFSHLWVCFPYNEHFVSFALATLLRTLVSPFSQQA